MNYARCILEGCKITADKENGEEESSRKVSSWRNRSMTAQQRQQLAQNEQNTRAE